MPIQVTEPLFAWDCLEDSRTLKTITQLLGASPARPSSIGGRRRGA